MALSMFALSLMGVAQAQDSAAHLNHWRLAFGAMRGTTSQIRVADPGQETMFDDPTYKGVVTAEWSRRLGSCLEVGAYLGLKDGKRLGYDTIGTTNPATGAYVVSNTEFYQPRKAFMLGMTGRLHLLPMAGRSSNRWDVYLSGRVGGWTASTTFLDWGLGAGVNYFPTRHFGLFLENNWGKFGVSHMGRLRSSAFQCSFGVIIR